MCSLTLPVQPGQMDDSHKRINGNADVSKKSSVPSRYHQFMTSEDEAQSSSAHSSEEEEDEKEEVEATTGKSVNSAQSVSPAPPQVKSEPPAPARETSQVLKFPPGYKTNELFFFSS